MVQRFGSFKKIAYLCIRIRNNKFNHLKIRFMEKVFLVNVKVVIGSCRDFGSWSDEDILKLASTSFSDKVRVFGGLRAFCYAYETEALPSPRKWHLRVIDTRKVYVEWETDDIPNHSLPVEVEVPAKVLSEEMADWLSNHYDHCVNCWKFC